MLEPGDLIDVWVVEKRLGSGGMGSVYRCHNSATSRILAAVKVLEKPLQSSSEAHQRFIREAEILFRLDHPNIVRVRNVRMDADPPYLEMEFVEGTSLERRIAAGPTSLPEALGWMEQVVAAVKYMHGRNVRHRDIKPANLLVTSRGLVKLVDFGLAVETDLSRITQEGLNFGTVSYAPPEWIDPERLDPVQWDLYALGVLFFELITGAHAFPMSGEGPLRKQLLQVMVTKQSAPPLDPGTTFPDEVRELIRDLTATEPDDRPSTAAQVSERLAGIRARVDGGLWPELDDLDADDNTVPGPTPYTTPRREEVDPDTLEELEEQLEDEDALAPPASVAPVEGLDSVSSAPTPTALPVPAAPSTAVAGRIAVLGILLGVVVTVGVGVWLSGGTPPVSVDGPSPALDEPHGVLRVEFDGLDGLPAFVRFGEVQAPVVEGMATLELPPGAHEGLWIAGAGCAEVCPGETCASWCGTGPLSVAVPQDDDAPVTVPVVVDPGVGRVTVKLPRLMNEVVREGPFKKKRPVWYVEVRVDGRRGTMENHYTAVFRDVPPGDHEIVASVGGCPEEAWGCWPDGDCPSKCRSAVSSVEIPWGGGSEWVRVRVPAPGAD